MFSHLFLGSNDVDRSQKFYDAVFGALGAKPGKRDDRNRIAYEHNGCRLFIGKPLNGEPATFANGATIGILMDSPEIVDAWHAAGVANGGTTCEDPPGLRPGGAAYLAYLRDPDGNKFCALCRMPAKS